MSFFYHIPSYDYILTLARNLNVNMANIFNFATKMEPLQLQQIASHIKENNICWSGLTENLQAQILGNSISIIYADQNNVIIAATIKFKYDDSESNVIGIIILTMCSHFEFRGKGYGKMMIDTIISVAKNMKLNTIELNPTKISLAFYQRVGFSYDPTNNKAVLSLQYGGYKEKYLKYKKKYLELLKKN